jgi:hypothetical protein
MFSKQRKSTDKTNPFNQIFLLPHCSFLVKKKPA